MEYISSASSLGLFLGIMFLNPLRVQHKAFCCRGHGAQPAVCSALKPSPRTLRCADLPTVISIDSHRPLERDGTVRLFSVFRTGRWIKTSELEILRKLGRIIGRASSIVLEITEPAQLAGSGPDISGAAGTDTSRWFREKGKKAGHQQKI